MQKWIAVQEKERKFQESHLKPRKIDASSLCKTYFLPRDFFCSLRLLEVGANMNSPIHHIKDAEVAVGIDPLSNFYASALPNGSQQIQGRGEELPFKSKIFDAVLCQNVLDHTENPFLVLQEINDVLKSTGILFLSIHVFTLPTLLRKYVLGKIDSVHPHHFSIDELTKMLVHSGFQITILPKKINTVKYVLYSVAKEVKSKRYFSAFKIAVAIGIFRLQNVWLRCKKI